MPRVNITWTSSRGVRLRNYVASVVSEFKGRVHAVSLRTHIRGDVRGTADTAAVMYSGTMVLERYGLTVAAMVAGFVHLAVVLMWDVVDAQIVARRSVESEP